MNPVVHFELPYKDAKRAIDFYHQVFGWKTELLGPDMGDYILITTAEKDIKAGSPAGAINGGMFPYKSDWPDQYPSIVIGVEDIYQSIEKVNKNGGSVHGSPMEVPGIGLYVSFKDTEGNRCSILQPKM